MRTQEEIQARLAAIAREWEVSGRARRRDLNTERYTIRWMLGQIGEKPQKVKPLASKIIKNAMA